MSTQPCTVCRAGLCFVGVRGEPGKADRTFLATLRAVICQNPFIEILNEYWMHRMLGVNTKPVMNTITRCYQIWVLFFSTGSEENKACMAGNLKLKDRTRRHWCCFCNLWHTEDLVPTSFTVRLKEWRKQVKLNYPTITRPEKLHNDEVHTSAFLGRLTDLNDVAKRTNKYLFFWTAFLNVSCFFIVSNILNRKCVYLKRKPFWEGLDCWIYSCYQLIQGN